MFRYSEDDLREALPRTIWIRWPRERLLMLTPCTAERVLTPLDWHGAAPARRYYDARQRVVDGFLAATNGRLLYEERRGTVWMARLIAAVFGLLAGAGLLFGRDLMMFLVVGTFAALAWAATKVAEPLLLGRRQFSFDDIGVPDADTQRIELAGPGGEHVRVHIPDPSDFALIAGLVTGRGRESAA